MLLGKNLKKLLYVLSLLETKGNYSLQFEFKKHDLIHNDVSSNKIYKTT